MAEIAPPIHLPDAPEILHSETHVPASGHHEAAGAPHLNPASYPSQLFWLTVTFLALYVLLARLFVPRVEDVLQQRRLRIEGDLEYAEHCSKRAQEARVEYEQMQAAARSKLQQEVTAARGAAEAATEKKFSEVDMMLEARLSEARAALERKRMEVHTKLIPVAREVAAQVVEKITGITPAAADIAKVIKD